MHRNRDLLHEMGLRELLHGKIDAHVQRRILRTALLPFTNLPAAFLQNPFADRHDGSGSFGHRDKFMRRDRPGRWNGSLSVFTSRFTAVRASFMSLRSSSRIVNSSPPKRATVSPGRTVELSR